MLKCNIHALFMESNIDLSMWKACNSDLYFFTEGFFLNRKFAYHIYNGFSVTCLKVTLKTPSIPHCEDGTTNRRGHNFSFFLTALKYKINSSHPVSPLFITWHKSWQSFFFYVPGTSLSREHSVSYKMSHWLHSNWKPRIPNTSSSPIFPLIGTCSKFTVH